MLTNLCTYELNNPLTYKQRKLNNSLKVQVYEQNNPLTYKQRKLNNPQIRHCTNLKTIRYVLQNTPHLPPLSSEIRGLKHAIWHYFQSFTFQLWSNFKKSTCILHHLAFLFWLIVRNFSDPKTHFQPLKSYLLTPILPLLNHVFHGSKGFYYTIAVYFYAYRLPFCRILPCVLHHFTLRFAPKRTVFSTKMRCVQHQNVLRLAPKCSVTNH